MMTRGVSRSLGETPVLFPTALSNRGTLTTSPSAMVGGGSGCDGGSFEFATAASRMSEADRQ